MRNIDPWEKETQIGNINQTQFTDICNATATFSAVLFRIAATDIAGQYDPAPQAMCFLFFVQRVRSFATSLCNDRCRFTDYRTFAEPIETHEIVGYIIEKDYVKSQSNVSANWKIKPCADTFRSFLHLTRVCSCCVELCQKVIAIRLIIFAGVSLFARRIQK